MASGIYNSGAEYLIKAGDASTLTFKAMLLDNTYVFDKDHNRVSDVVSGGKELVATGYTGGYGGAGRKTLTTVVVTKDTVNDRIVVDCDDVAFGALGGATNDTIRFMAIIVEITSDAASIPIACHDFGADTPTNGSTVTALINAIGLFYSQQ